MERIADLISFLEQLITKDGTYVTAWKGDRNMIIRHHRTYELITVSVHHTPEGNVDAEANRYTEPVSERSGNVQPIEQRKAS